MNYLSWTAPQLQVIVILDLVKEVEIILEPSVKE
jgi:hypothetical protein